MDWIAQQIPDIGRVIVSSNNMDVLCELAARGLGATEVPCYIGEFNDRLVDHLVDAFARLAPAFEGKLKPRSWDGSPATSAAASTAVE